MVTDTIRLFEEKVAAALEKEIPSSFNGAALLAAVSGGADSMAMLAALCATQFKKRLYCLHVEHGLRPADESRGDAEFVRAFCEKQGVDCSIVSIPPGKIAAFAKRKRIGIEAAARHFRHRSLSRKAAQIDGNVFILLAHTKDDLLETALMRVLRGAGPAGLAAMPQKRGRLMRPLLSLTRAEVIEYLKAKNLSWREDSTNIDEKFLRNRIRRRLVPVLDESFPSWRSGLIGMAETQSLAAQFLADEAQKIFEKTSHGVHRGTKDTEEERRIIYIDAENFFKQSEIIKEEIIFLGIDRILIGKTSFVSRRAVIRKFCLGEVAAVDLGAVSLRCKGGEVLLSLRRKERSESGFSLLIKEPGLYNLKNICIEVRPFDGKEKSGGFLTALPLVFRKCFKDDFLYKEGRKVAGRDLGRGVICAVDSLGPAAFIGSERIVERDIIEDTGGLFSVIIKAGRDYVWS